MAYEIKTSRLFLRPITPEDLGQLHRLWTDPDVRKYIWDGVAITWEDAAAIIEQSVDCFNRLGYGLWVVLQVREPCIPGRGNDTSIEPANDFIIGFCGFWLFRDPPELELIYGFAPPYWGRGLATEAALAMIQYGFDRLSFESIAGSTDPANASSTRVMERAGMRLIRRATVGGLDTVFYAISKLQPTSLEIS
jgi:ribosomal-protein-alanine N-acetyltransferase